MTAKEILEKIEKQYEDIDEYAYTESGTIEGVGTFEEVEQKGGEGEGSTWTTVKHFVDHNIYIETVGFYQSHYGTDFEDGYGYEVKPTEVLITVYKPI